MFLHDVSIRCVAASAMISLVITGCESNPRPNVVAGPGRLADDPLPAAAYPKIVPLDDIERMIVLQSDPVVSPMTAGSGEGARKIGLNVRVPIRSVINHDLVMKYRFIYYDDSGAEIDRAPWDSIRLPAKSANPLVGQTLRPAATDWRLEIARRLRGSPIG